MRFSGRVAIVTGAANGIGFATARLLVQEGASLAAVDVDQQGLNGLVTELEGAPGEVVIYPSDVLDPEQVAATVVDVLARWSRLDILVNCVGGSTVIDNDGAVVEAMEPDEWRRMIDFNLLGTFLYCRAVLPHMKRQESGKIVNLSSGSRHGRNRRSSAAYAASKAAVVALTAKLGHEAGPYGVNVNAVAPSLTLTARIEERRWGFFSAEAKKATLANLGVKQLAKAEDQARVIAFLASEDANYVIGQTLDVGGAP